MTERREYLTEFKKRRMMARLESWEAEAACNSHGLAYRAPAVIAELRAALALPSVPDKPTLPTDVQRLDWIEANHACFGHHRETGRWWSRAGRSFTSCREAIDAAMLRKL